jgi:DNA-binding winged helix-turn-helix (wHTH) protein/tetratricopeptide (TPR) repeat protein
MFRGENQTGKDLYEFGPFRVDPEKQALLRGDEPIAVTPKAFQVLLVLVRHNSQTVSKDELMLAVWPDTFVEETNLTRNIFALRKALGEDGQNRYIITVSGQGYRLADQVRVVPGRQLNVVAATHSRIEVAHRRRWPWILAGVLVLVVAVGLIRLIPRRAPALTEKDTVVLTDFVNNTGDPVFDGTLRQGLAIQLEQSPFLSLISDQQIQQTLRLMGQPLDARLAPQLAHDLCERTQSAAYLTGSITSLGSQYVLGLKAVSCPGGKVLADEQEKATGKEAVLGALDKAAGKLREKLGEGLSTVEKFNTPLDQATTPSLEALQAYTLGRKTQAGRDEFAAAVPFYRRAIQFDPKFAIAHAALGVTYEDLGETVLGAEYMTKAYELDAPISEPERFYVETAYDQYALGDLDRARQAYAIWVQIYPRSSTPGIRLGELYSREGKNEDALPQIREAIRLDPWKGVSVRNLLAILIQLDQLQEAASTAQHAVADGFDSPMLRAQMYKLAFLESDASEMARQAESVTGKPGGEGQMLELEAETAAYSGHLRESRVLSRRAVESAMRAGESEVATSFEANAAFREALIGGRTEVRAPPAEPARGVATGRKLQYATALSLALAGNPTRAQVLADGLAKRYPDDTLVQFNYLPAVRAQIALNHGDSSKAVELLLSARPYELSGTCWGFLGPVYVRGEAYLMAHRGIEAAAEFQKILDHRGIVANSPSGALAHLQLGRAYVLSGDRNKAKTAYQAFLTLWRDADPDIPILQQARAEYARLQ